MKDRFKATVVVFVGLRNEKGEILLQQRANTGFMDGFWDFSASGHLEEGESIRECAIRELKEEIGVEARESDLRLVHVNQNHFDFPYLNFTFMLDTWQGTPMICEPGKCSGLEYFAVNNLPDKCTVNIMANKQDVFSGEMSYSYIDKTNYKEIMGREWQ